MSATEPEWSPIEEAGAEEPTFRLRRRTDGPAAAPAVGTDSAHRLPPRRGLRHGLDLVDTDHDPDPLRDLPEFQRLMVAVRAAGPAGPAANGP